MNDELTDRDDRQIASALHNVSIPAGLRDRLHTALRDAAETPLTNASSEAVGSEAVGSAATMSEPLAATDQSIPLAAALPSHSRRGWLAVASAAVLAAVLFGAYHLSRPSSYSQIANHSLQQLELIRQGHYPVQTIDAASSRELRPLWPQLKRDLAAIGMYDIAPPRQAEAARAWQLQSRKTGKDFFVFAFHGARRVEGLNSQLQSIHRVSGGWSLVAMQADGRLFVVAYQGSIEDYINLLQAA